MLKLGVWEEFIIGAAVSFLGLLAQKIKNPVELAGIESALAFLQRLLAGSVSLVPAAVAEGAKEG